MLLFKNSFIKIRKSLGRFFSLIFIVALGSAFFAGVRETSSDMIKTADAYYDEYHLLDFRIVSTMGLTDDDILSLEELENVEKVVPGYSFETVVDGEASKVYGYLEDINKAKLVEGRYLENENEINQRIYVFPNAALEENGKKISYFTYISSLKNPDCNAALERIYPKIDMVAIQKIIQETPGLCQEQRDFYYIMLSERKEKILDYSMRLLLKQEEILENQDMIEHTM